MTVKHVNGSIGHNSLAAGIERTAEEIRANYLVTHAGEGSSEHWRMLYPVLLNQKLSDAAKVQYALLLPERKNFKWSNERTAKLTGKTPRTVERLFDELGAENCVKSTRRKQKPSMREFPAPENGILAAAKELLARFIPAPAGNTLPRNASESNMLRMNRKSTER